MFDRRHRRPISEHDDHIQNDLTPSKTLLGLLSWDCSGETDFLGLARVRGAMPKLGKQGISIDYLSPNNGSRRGAG